MSNKDNLKKLEQLAQSKLGAAIDRMQEYKYFGRIVVFVVILAFIGIFSMLL